MHQSINLQNNTPPQSPSSSLSRVSAGKRVVARNKRYLERENEYLRHQLRKREVEIRKYKMRLSRNQKNNNNFSNDNTNYKEQRKYYIRTRQLFICWLITSLKSFKSKIFTGIIAKQDTEKELPMEWEDVLKG